MKERGQLRNYRLKIPWRRVENKLQWIRWTFRS